MAQFNYHIELRNTRDELTAILQDDITSLDWSFDSLGGCAVANVALQRTFDAFGDIGLEYDVQIYRIPGAFGATSGATLPAELPFQLGESFESFRELRYSGYIRQMSPLLDEVEKVTFSCSGYSRQLEGIIIPSSAGPFSGEVADIVKSIIDNYVVPQTRIKRTDALGLVQATGVLVNSVNFDTSAWEAIKFLAEIGGNAEWGCLSGSSTGADVNREFYFTPRGVGTKQVWEIGDKIKLYQPVKNIDELVSKVFVRGASGLEAIITNGNFGGLVQKQRVVSLPFITGAADATLWGSAYFARFGSVQPRGTLRLGATDAWIEQFGAEAMPPLGRLRVHGGPIFIYGGEAGDALPAQLPIGPLAGVYGGRTDELFRIESVHYRPTDNGLDIDIELGEKRNSLSDYFRSIEYRLSTARQAIAGEVGGSGVWMTVDLEGSKDGVNRIFIIPVGFSTAQILFNSQTLYRVGSSPAATEYTLVGDVVTLGYAPQAGDRLWAQYI